MAADAHKYATHPTPPIPKQTGTCFPALPNPGKQGLASPPLYLTSGSRYRGRSGALKSCVHANAEGHDDIALANSPSKLPHQDSLFGLAKALHLQALTLALISFPLNCVKVRAACSRVVAVLPRRGVSSCTLTGQTPDTRTLQRHRHRRRTLASTLSPATISALRAARSMTRAPDR